MKKNLLKFTPLKMLGVTNPAIEIVYERRIGKRLGLEAMGSALMPTSVFDIGGFKPHNRGFRFSLEEKVYYFNRTKKNRMGSQYIGFEVNYMWNRFRAMQRFAPPGWEMDSTLTDLSYLDSIGIAKQMWSMSVKWGFQLVYKHFCFDAYAGFGVRHKNVVHSERLNPADGLYSTSHENFFIYTYDDGKRWTICIPLNVRIGWAF